MTTSRTILEDAIKPALLNGRDVDNLFALEPENTFFQDSDLLSQDSDLLSQDSDLLSQDSDLLSQDSDPLFQDSDTFLALDNVDMCDESQSSLNLFLDSPTSLNARDLADELPGFNEFIAPLNQLKDSTCVAPDSPRPGNNQPSRNNNPNPSVLLQDKSKPTYQLTPDGYCYFMGVVSPSYPFALCCDGRWTYESVQGCTTYEFGPKCEQSANQYCCRSYISLTFVGIRCVAVRYDRIDRAPPTAYSPPSRPPPTGPPERVPEPVPEPPSTPNTPPDTSGTLGTPYYEEPWFGKPGFGED